MDQTPAIANSSRAHLFGPVPSRRLGRSLGIDLVPLKTCPHDCIYCQLGRTTRLTCERRPYVSADRLIAQLGAWVGDGSDADYLTFSGSGEPTLNSHIGRIISWLKNRSRVPVAVLTNGALLGREDVRRDIRAADLIIPSLDAGTPECFAHINRPVAGVRLEDTIDGLMRLRREFARGIWLEVMLVGGVNDNTHELNAIRDVIDQVRPARVQIGTVVRPPSEGWVRPVSEAALRRAERLLGPSAEVIVPPRFRQAISEEDGALPARIVELLGRRPCTSGDIAAGLGVHPNWVAKHLSSLIAAGDVGSEVRGQETYYRAN